MSDSAIFTNRVRFVLLLRTAPKAADRFQWREVYNSNRQKYTML